METILNITAVKYLPDVVYHRNYIPTHVKFTDVDNVTYIFIKTRISSITPNSKIIGCFSVNIVDCTSAIINETEFNKLIKELT